MTLSRRNILQLSLAAGSTMALAACSSGNKTDSAASTEGEQIWDGRVFDAKGETLRLAMWAAPFGDFAKEFAINQFEKDFNCKVQYDSAFPWFPKMAAAGAENPPFDLTNWNAWELAKTALAGDYFVSVDTFKKNLSEADNLWPFAFENGYGVSYMYTQYGFAYRKDMVSPPTTFKDFWKPEYDGKRATYGTDNGLQIDFFLAAANAFGGDYKDLDAGYKAMKDGASWKVIDFTGNMQAKLTSGELAIGVLDDGEAFQIMDKGADIGFTYWEGYQPILTQTLAVSKHTSPTRQRLAYALADRMCGAPFLQQFGQAQYQRPANKNAVIPQVLADRGVANTADGLSGFAKPDWKWFAEVEPTVTRQVESIFAS